MKLKAYNYRVVKCDVTKIKNCEPMGQTKKMWKMQVEKESKSVGLERRMA